MKQEKPNLIQYLLATPTEEILDGSEIVFHGGTERERQESMVKFMRIRGIIQRFGRELTPDDNETLLAILKGCVVQKKDLD
jgi:hypothetical protein